MFSLFHPSSLGGKGEALLARGGNHDPFKIRFVGGGFYGPMKKKVGTCSSQAVLFIDYDFHGFHGPDEDGFLKIATDGTALGIKIFGLIDVDGIL